MSDAIAPAAPSGPPKRRPEPELTQELLSRLPPSLALRLCSKLASARPEFAARGWIGQGCWAHEEKADAFDGASGSRSWEKYPAAPLELARAGHWEALLECLEAMRGRQERFLAWRKSGSPAVEPEPASPFKDPRNWRESPAGARLMSEGAFLTQLMARCAGAEPQRAAQVAKAALAACGWDGPGEERAMGGSALGALAQAGSLEALELLAPYWAARADRRMGRPKEDWEFLSAGRIKEGALRMGQVAGAPTLAEPGARAASEDEPAGPLARAMGGVDPAGAIRAIKKALPGWGADLAVCEERWAAQSPDDDLARSAIEAAARERQEQMEREAQRGKKKKKAKPAGIPPLVAMGMLDRVAAGDGDRAEWMLRECARLGLCESIDPCDALLGGPVSLASAAISLGRLSLAAEWIRRREEVPGEDWGEDIPVVLEAGGELVDAGSGPLTATLIEFQFEEDDWRGRGLSAEGAAEADLAAPAGRWQARVPPLAAALLARDLNLAKALLEKARHPAIEIRRAIQRAEVEPRLKARMERALLELDVEAAPRAPGKKGRMAL